LSETEHEDCHAVTPEEYTALIEENIPDRDWLLEILFGTSL
jgi:hypothetical protein